MNITVDRKVIEQALEALVAAYQGKDKTNQVTESITALRTALEQPERKPLTDAEIKTYRHMIDWTASWSYINFARAIEAAHGIKE